MNHKQNIDPSYYTMFATYDDIVTADEVSTMLHLSKKRVYRMLRAGVIRSIKVEGCIRIAKVWVIDYVQKYGLQRQESFTAQRRAAVAVYCQTPRSRKQIQEYLDLSDKKFFRDTVLHPLLAEGVIRMTIPENPGHVHQRYIATEKLTPTQKDADE